MFDCGENTKLTNEILNKINYLCLNERWLKKNLGFYDPLKHGIETIRTKLLNDNPHLNILLKLGNRGSWFTNNDTSIFLPSICKFSESIEGDFIKNKLKSAGNAFLNLHNFLGNTFVAAFFTKLMEMTDNYTLE